MSAGQQLDKIRVALGFTKSKMAESLGLEPGSYSDIVRGKTKNVSKAVLLLAELVHNANIDFLMERSNQMFLQKERISNKPTLVEAPPEKLEIEQPEIKTDNPIEQTINTLLKKQRYYQRELCSYLGISESGIKKMHKEQSYKLSTLQKIADFFKVDIAELIKTNIKTTANLTPLKAEEPLQAYSTSKTSTDQSDLMELKMFREFTPILKKANEDNEKEIEKLETENHKLKDQLAELTKKYEELKHRKTTKR